MVVLEFVEKSKLNGLDHQVRRELPLFATQKISVLLYHLNDLTSILISVCVPILFVYSGTNIHKVFLGKHA